MMLTLSGGQKSLQWNYQDHILKMNIQQNMFAKSRGVESKVQHRSDLLMNDQMQLVHDVQTNLSNALQQLEKEKDPLHIQQLRLSVAELQAQSQKYILALKVMDKINTELIYARVELQEAIQQGHDNVNLSRKRVIWLEDKMGELCGKRKLKGIEDISDSKAMKEETKQNNHLKLSSESQPSKDEHQFHEIKDHNEQDLVENTDSVTTIVETNLVTTDGKGTLNLQITAENKTEECESPTHEDNESFENEDFRDCLATPRSNNKKTYLTEVEGQTEEYNRETNKSSLSSGTESEWKVSSNTEERHRDLASEYWQSEHHRFEYSQFANQFLEADPLSYHQVGLAVPGSFIQKEDLASVFQELPWRSRRKESEIKDVHRVALDKLAARIHGLYYKVYDAAQLSVRSWHKRQDKENKKDYGSLAPLKIKPKDQLSNEVTLYEHKTIKGKDKIYSKTLLPPTILPITRTSWNKEFPRFASSFCKPDPESRTMTERIVDQRNLIEETKIVLYKDKSKRPLPGAANLEKKFQKMIESEAGTNTKTSGKKLRTSFKAAVAVTKLHSATNNWNQIKPESRGKQYSGLRWERVKTIVHVHLQSPRVEERIDGARQLGALRCGDTMVTYALKERIENDTEDRVRYEAAKALVLIGCWDEEVLACVLKYLVLGNMEIRSDLIQTIANGKNVQFVNKNMPLVIELAKVLSHFCQNPDPDDIIAFQAAVCLGQLCVKDIHAQDRLVKTLEESPDTHIKAKALEILVKQLHFTDDNVVQHIEDMLRDSPVWSFRALACNLLISLGPNHECVIKHNEKIYQLLERRLWDDPSMEVRLTAAKSLTALGMFTRACDNVVLKLEDLEEEKRAQAAIAVGTLGLKNEKVIRLLLEMLELDSSDYIRLMIIRTFRILKLMDRRVIRSLRDRERLEGAIGRECGKALKVLDQTSALVA
uniref:HEAT repeat-containing protein 4 n=1 Tax=Biomphalaria glabrata TaxID=6526 RepID=A0A2C9LNZ8_BIOGL